MKTNELGKLGKYKARVVAKGFRQVEWVDYEETFTPTVRFESVRALVAMAAGGGLELDQMDVTTAFMKNPWLDSTNLTHESNKVPIHSQSLQHSRVSHKFAPVKD